MGFIESSVVISVASIVISLATIIMNIWIRRMQKETARINEELRK